MSMKVTFKPTAAIANPLANKPVGNKTVVKNHKTVASPETRFLTKEEIKANSSGMSDSIVNCVMDEISKRFAMPPSEAQITQADAFQVAINAMAIASAIVVLEGAEAGLPLEKAREIHDALYKAALNGS